MQASISGSSGFIGSALLRELSLKGWKIKVIDRQALSLSLDDFRKNYMEGSNLVINLAGAPIQRKWTDAYKKEIVSSRVETTRKIVQAIAQMEVKPDLFISASAVGIYDATHAHTEESLHLDQGFLGSVCKAWEAEAKLAEPLTRTIIFRLGVVLGKNGGALEKMHPLFRSGLGGKLGRGDQYMPFIHLDDVLEAFHFVIEHTETQGVYNLVAPYPVTNYEFTDVYAKVLNQMAFLTVPAFALKWKFGESAIILLEGQNVRPERLEKAGFTWKYPSIRNALTAIYRG